MWDKKEPEIQRGQQLSSVPKFDAHTPAVPSSGSGAATRGRAANIGGSLFIKGEVSGSEDMTVEGQVEGRIHLKDHNLSIAQSGRVNAEIHAKSVTIHGEVTGNVHADEKIEIAETGRLMGDVHAPRVAISDGAQFRGSVDMSQGQVAASSSSKERSHMSAPASAPASASAGNQVQVAAAAKMAGSA